VARTRSATGRGLILGLALVWLGGFFYLSQTTWMSTQMWLAYLTAGLGVILVVWGLLRYSARPVRLERPKTGVKVTAEPPRGGKFSGQLGLEHNALMGRKILFELDPSTPYQRVIRDFALECISNNETVVILTPSGSVIHQALEGEEDIKLINLTPDTMLSPILEEHAQRPLNLVYDSLTDLALSADSRTAYRFAMNSLRQLSDAKITALFLLNPSAHELKDVSSLRGLFSNQVTYGKDGMSSIKFT